MGSQMSSSGLPSEADVRAIAGRTRSRRVLFTCVLVRSPSKARPPDRLQLDRRARLVHVGQSLIYLSRFVGCSLFARSHWPVNKMKTLDRINRRSVVVAVEARDGWIERPGRQTARAFRRRHFTTATINHEPASMAGS